MLRMATREIADIAGQARDHSLRPLPRAGADGSDHSLRAEFISVRIERLGDAVGVKHEAIIAFEGDGNVAGYPIEHVSAVNSTWAERYSHTVRPGADLAGNVCIWPTSGRRIIGGQ